MITKFCMANQLSALTGVVDIPTCHAITTRNDDIPAQGTMIVIATTAASWTHSKVQRRLARSFRTIAARTATPITPNGTNQSGDTVTSRIVPPAENCLKTGQP